jgi:uncharacterized protein YggL (DUF469 family)
MSAACPRLAFTLRLHPRPGTAADPLADALGTVLAARGLEGEPVGGDRWTVVVTREGGQATHDDREALAAWAAARDDLSSCDVGPIVDLSA